MDILDAIGLGKETHKTRAMASAYLDIRNFERHLDTLVAGGFVHLRVDGRYKYLSVTPEGELLLRRLCGVSVLYAPEEGGDV